MNLAGYHPGYSSLGKKTGTYGAPMVKYYGPGWDKKRSTKGLFDGKLSSFELLSDTAYGPQKGDVVYDAKLGKGIVLGKYSREKARNVEVSDYDIKEIKKDTDAYRDALELAVSSDYYKGGSP